MSFDELISRQDLLAGLPAKRTNTLLFLIERQTTRLAAQSRVEFSLTDSAERDRELAFLEAFAVGKAPALRPTIQNLERFAPQWSVLVPNNPTLKAALLNALCQKYNFTKQLVPNIRAALNCDQLLVEQAYQRLYQKPIAVAFSSQISLKERLSWIAAASIQKVESLPPFWIASLVTIALGLPQAFLALPIAVAELGPLASVAFLIVLGTINILTMVCMAESIARSGDFLAGKTFIKQLATNYLGKAGSLILSVAVGIRVFLIALACYIGLSATMASFTSLPAYLWAGLLFFFGLYILSRKSLNLTIGVTILLAGLNVSLLLFLTVLSFGHWQLVNVLYINWAFFDGSAFNLQIFHQVFGVTLMLYFGHVYVGECAKVVLPKDPSATSLIWGSIAGTAFLTFLFCLWVLAVNGAIAPQVLAAQTGTVLEPLAQQNGPIVKIVGAILITFLLGMAWFRSSSLLVNLAREWIPNQPQSILTLPRQQGRLILRTRDRYNLCSIGLTYLGLADGQPTFDLDIQLKGNIHLVQIKVARSWHIKELVPKLSDLNLYDVDLKLEIQSVSGDYVCLKVISTMAIAYEGALERTRDEDKTAHQQKSQKAIAQRAWAYLLEQRQFLFSITPLFLVFLLTEGLFFSGQQSFTSVLGFAGVLGNSLVGGIFPVLLLASSRQKGEILPGIVFKLLNSPWLLASIYGFSLFTLLLHGLFIWQNPLARIAALGVTVLSLAATLVMWQTGAFMCRTVIELQENKQQGGQTFFKITAGGRPKTAQVRLGYADSEETHQAASVEIPSLSSLRYAIFQLPTKQSEELRVWAHSNNPNGDSESLPALLEVNRENRKMQFDLKLFGGKVLLPLINGKYCLKLQFPIA